MIGANMNPTLARILDYLESHCMRATYRAVADYLHVIPRAVGLMLGPDCPKASSVVNAQKKMPTGYCLTEIPPGLKKNRHIIRTEKELRTLMG